MVKLSTVGLLLLLASCSKSPAYLHSQDERQVCHKKFQNGSWYPQQYHDVPLWLAYKEHIGMHPNDYWGYCKEEIVPIPAHIVAYPSKNTEGKWIEHDIRSKRNGDDDDDGDERDNP